MAKPIDNQFKTWTAPMKSLSLSESRRDLYYGWRRLADSFGGSRSEPGQDGNDHLG
jgi:hypothetical protein